MGKLSRYDAGELPEDRKKRRKTAKSRSAPSKSAIKETKQKVSADGLSKKSRSISNRIRDLKRLLAKVTDEEAKGALELKLQRLNRRFEFKERQDLLKKLSEKNRKLQFFDQKKLERRLKRSKDEEEKELIKNDLEYIRTFPRDRKYISLFDTTIDEKTEKERDDLRMKAALARAKRKEEEETSVIASDQEGYGDDFFKEEDEEEIEASNSEEDSE